MSIFWTFYLQLIKEYSLPLFKYLEFPWKQSVYNYYQKYLIPEFKTYNFLSGNVYIYT